MTALALLVLLGMFVAALFAIIVVDMKPTPPHLRKVKRSKMPCPERASCPYCRIEE